MAPGVVFLAGIIALPIAAGAWVLGFMNFGQAALAYVLVGWAVITAAVLSHMIGPLARRLDAAPERRPRSVVVHVSAAKPR
jgi:hypothetical protein